MITTEDEVEKGTARIVEANKFALPLVSDAWLREAEDKKNLPLLATHLIHCAGSVLEPAHESAPDRMLKRKRGGASQTVVARGGGAVDPASGLAEEGSTCAVLTEGSTVWSASLSLVDLRSGANSFYKLQVIVDTERANTKRATFFRAWGRLGTRQGACVSARLFVACSRNVKHSKALFFFRIHCDLTGSCHCAQGTSVSRRWDWPPRRLSSASSSWPRQAMSGRIVPTSGSSRGCSTSLTSHTTAAMMRAATYRA